MDNLIEKVREAMKKAKILIGAQNDTASPVEKEANIYSAWHVLNEALAALEAKPTVVPDGMALVPLNLIHKTKALIRSHVKAERCIEIDDRVYSAIDIYAELNRVYIAAAAQPPALPKIEGLAEALEPSAIRMENRLKILTEAARAYHKLTESK